MGASACRRVAPRLNQRHADFQSRVGSPEAIYFNELTGVRCSIYITVHNDAELIYAKFTQVRSVSQPEKLCCSRRSRAFPETVSLGAAGLASP